MPNLFNIVYCYPAWDYWEYWVRGYTKVDKTCFCLFTVFNGPSFEKRNTCISSPFVVILHIRSQQQMLLVPHGFVFALWILLGWILHKVPLDSSWLKNPLTDLWIHQIIDQIWREIVQVLADPWKGEGGWPFFWSTNHSWHHPLSRQGASVFDCPDSPQQQKRPKSNWIQKRRILNGKIRGADMP